MPETILGKVSVTPKGAYAAGTQYERLDAVSHGGGSWMALKTVQGVEPGTDPESWMQLAEKGKTGDTGPQGAPGKDGVDGSPGPAGQNGQDGAAATIQVGEVVTLEPGQPAAVENTGTEQAAVLKISIPRGQNGRDGDPGEDGGYYTPSVDGSGYLSWTASKAGMPPVEGTNIRGPQGPAGTSADPAQIDAIYNLLANKCTTKAELDQLFVDWWHGQWVEGESSYNMTASTASSCRCLRPVRAPPAS